MRALLLLLCLALLGGAGHARADSYEIIEVEDGGTISGRVSLTGIPQPQRPLVIDSDLEVCDRSEHLARDLVVGPEGGVRDALVNLRVVERGKDWPARDEYILEQTDCRFEPHVLLLPNGEDLHLVNNDRILHIVRSRSRESVFNVGQPRFIVELLVENFAHQVAEPKVVELACDLHKWMRGFVVLQRHPYYGLTSEDGTFRLTDVPPGEYELEFWHETLGEEVRRVTVAPNAETTILFEHDAASSADEPPTG